MEQKEVLLIIPAYNEEKNIGKVMDQLAQPEIAELVDVLVMNDASSDNTIWMVKQRGYAVVTHVFNLGISVTEAVCSLAINMRSAGATGT